MEKKFLSLKIKSSQTIDFKLFINTASLHHKINDGKNMRTFYYLLILLNHINQWWYSLFSQGTPNTVRV